MKHGAKGKSGSLAQEQAVLLYRELCKLQMTLLRVDGSESCSARHWRKTSTFNLCLEGSISGIKVSHLAHFCDS